MKKIAISLFLLGAAGVAIAKPIYRDNGSFYVGVFGAASYLYDSHSEDQSKFSHFGNAVIGSAGYQFNSFFATEIDYGYYHPTAAQSSFSKVTQTAIALKGIIPLVDDFSLYGKFGVADNTYKYSYSRGNRNDFWPLVGLGFAYSLSQTFEVGFLAQSAIGHHETDHGKKAWDGLSFIGAGLNVYF